MAINAIGNGIPFLRGIGIPHSIKNNMVLWYDIKRQGTTNETMKVHPILKDLSGNGHDATCYNFAWSGMSGIGGYYFDTLTKWYTSSNNDGKLTVNNTKIHITRTTTNSASFYYLNNNKRVESNDFIDSYTDSSITIKPFKIKVSGLPEGYDIVIDGIYTESVENSPQMIRKAVIHNGEHIIDIGTVNLENVVFSGQCHFPRIFTTANMPQIDCDITIEFLPEYPNALIADGVNDYVRVNDLPILTDYTVITKRKRLDIDLNKRGAIASKLKNDNSVDGAFLFEFIISNTGIHQVASFGTFINIKMVDTDTSYMTKNSYNGTPIKSGQHPDNNHLTLFSIRESSGCTQAALYSFILFDRTLTNEEINWVKENLIEGDVEI